MKWIIYHLKESTLIKHQMKIFLIWKMKLNRKKIKSKKALHKKKKSLSWRKLQWWKKHKKEKTREEQRGGSATIAKKSYSSSYTRIHHHFFGPPVGIKAEIGRCTSMLANRTLLQQIRKKVQDAEKIGISPSLTRSTVNKKFPATSSNPIEKAFGVVERHDVDIAIERFLCANGIPFNVLRSPEMASMTSAIKNAPKDYKHPSADRARTSLLDDCKREFEKECVSVSDTWSTQGTSIVSDGWTIVT
ncbi:hypothetical protein OROGR_021247 [Orobanche gracilis]